MSPDSIRRKRDRESHNIRDAHSSDAILHAAMSVLKEMGYAKAAKVHQIIMNDPTAGDSIADLLENPAPPPVEKLSRVGALSYMLHHDLTKHDYNCTKDTSKRCNADFLPCYDYIREEKKNCRPPEDTVGYVIRETEAVIPLQALAIHTVDRIFDIPKVSKCIEEEKKAGNDVEVKLDMKIGNDT